MAAELIVRTQNKKGNEPKLKYNVGRVDILIDEDVASNISIDSFEGQGDSYKQREFSEIVISYDGFEEFRGTLKELITLLHKK
jgi:hypothetical protein